MNIHKHMSEKFELAQTYAEDGAFHTAAAILARLALEVKDHAMSFDRAGSAAWTAHTGEDYAVVMRHGETTDNAAVRVSTDDPDLPAKIAALLNALGNR